MQRRNVSVSYPYLLLLFNLNTKLTWFPLLMKKKTVLSQVLLTGRYPGLVEQNFGMEHGYGLTEVFGLMKTGDAAQRGSSSSPTIIMITRRA